MNEINNTKTPPRILVVDDDLAMRLLFSEALEPEGFDIVEAENGEEAIELCEKNNFDLILLDVMMPVKDGFEACKGIREISNMDHLPIVMVTALDDVDSITRASEVGATDFITKPIYWPILAHRLRYMLKASHALAALRHSEEQVKQLAYYDVLTGLPNRLLFREHVQYALDQAERNGGGVAIMFLDLDNFKQINDSLGHDVGDELLRQFGERLIRLTRKTDTSSRRDANDPGIKMSRLGGDEFTVLLTGVSKTFDVGRIANRIVTGISSSFTIYEHEMFITTCLGISLYPLDGTDIETLLKHADVAMYNAKSSGRNTYCFYDAAMNADAIDRLKLENSLRIALENKQFQLYYQPRVDVATGEVKSVEALLRWHHPTLGLIMPDQFIPIAEDTRLIIPIGEWVVEEACRQIMLWHDSGYNSIKMAVNLSAIQFSDDGLKSTLLNILERSGCRPEYLELEITESALMIDREHSIEILEFFRETGLSLSIDDFGIGYSSLSSLKDFPIDVLKIDRSFIENLPDDTRAGAIVSAIINLAQMLNLMVVGEGVENEAQLDFLKELHCDQYQGYYFSKPLPENEIAKKLTKSKRREVVS